MSGGAGTFAVRMSWAARFLREFGRWLVGRYPVDRSYPRGWLWPLARLVGLLPVSFKDCSCPVRNPPLASSRVPSAANSYVGQPGKECGCPVAERSLPWAVYSLVIMSLLVPSTVAALFKDHDSARKGHASLRMTTTTDEMVTFFDILSVTGSSIVISIQAIFSQYTLFVLLEQLQQVDALLHIRPPAVPGIMALWLMLVAVVVLMDGSMWIEMSDELINAAAYFPFYGLYFVTIMMEALFIDDANSIYMRFLALNERLDSSLLVPSYQAATEMSPSLVPDVAWGVSTRQGISVVSGSPTNISKSDLSAMRRQRLRPVTMATHTPPISTQRLNMAHHLLCESASTVARRYGLSLLADMLCLLLHLVITAYFFFKHLLLTQNAARLRVGNQYIVVQAAWLAVHLGRMIMIVLPCSRANAEASRTGALVGVVLSTTSPSTLAHKQLEAFSIQLLHHKVNFNACGLFELGLPLVVSTLGAVTTYLVVLLQLRAGPTEVPVNATTPAHE